MSLQGSLNTVALPEVLHLLSDTSKSGELEVAGESAGGRLWFAAGKLAGFEVGRSEAPADALFELLRITSGTFSFDTAASVPSSAHASETDGGEDIRPVLDEAERRLAEWATIVAVVPSLQHVVRLRTEAPHSEVLLDAGQWSMIVAIGEGRTVHDVLERHRVGEFHGCKGLKVLVEAGLVDVKEPYGSAAGRDGAARELLDLAAGLDAGGAPPEFARFASNGAGHEEEPFAEDAAAADEQQDEAAFAEPAVADFYAHAFAFDVGPDGDGALDGAAPAGADGELTGGAVDRGGDGPEAAPGEPVPGEAQLGEAQLGEMEPGEMEPDDAAGARQALHALLAEFATSDGIEDEGGAGFAGSTVEEPVDGLADRGPWTDGELERMSAWGQEETNHDVDGEAEDGYQQGFQGQDGDGGADAAEPETAEPVSDEEVAPEPEPEPEPEPINRGLLLKFLSSVRS